MDLLRVAASTPAPKLAGAVSAQLRDHRCVELQMIGAGAISQCIKALAIARGHLAPSGFDLAAVPSFVDFCDASTQGEEHTAIKLTVNLTRRVGTGPLVIDEPVAP